MPDLIFRRATAADVPAIIKMLADDTLGASREALGAEVLLHFPTTAVARVHPQTAVREGDPLRLVVDTRRLHFFDAASGLAIGVMAGFFWYGVVHHAIHYRKPRTLATRLLLATRRHAQHHYAREPGNFGVTTSFWDHVFGTTLNAVRDRQVQTD